MVFSRIAGGDEAAFREIFHEYNARLFPFVVKVTESEDAAREILQEAFLRLWLHRKQVAAMDNPVGWLYRVANNLALSHLRTKAARYRHLKSYGMMQEMKPAQDLNPTEMGIDARETEQMINEAIARLPEKRQEIYRLSREEGLSLQEIAGLLHLSPNTVKNQLVTASRQVQQYLHQMTECLVPIGVLLLLMQS